MRRLLYVPLLFGMGFLFGDGSLHTASGQIQGGKGGQPAPVRPPVNGPAPPSPPRPVQVRPAPRPSIPTPSRPPAQPQPTPQPQRPAIGVRPNIVRPGGGTAGNPISWPIPPRPVNPSPIQPGGLVRPTVQPNLFPGGLGGTIKPTVKPGLLTVTRPGGNSNVRPGIQPSKPDVALTRPGINYPNRPGTKPNLPTIGVRPNLPTHPDRPNVDWTSRPGTRPIGLVDPTRPGGNRPTVQWPNRPGQPIGGARPGVVNRPGIYHDGSHNTIVNRPTHNVNVNNINRHSGYYNNPNYRNFGGYRPGVGDAIHGWHSAWYGNYYTWHHAYHPWYQGYWRGNSFDTWGVGPISWGFNMWGLNSLRYSFGYTPYLNPFYVVPDPTVFVQPYQNYSQPIINVVQALPDSGQEPPPMPETASQAFDAAVVAFKNGEYPTALADSEAALKDFPNDPVLHEFRALTLFALGQYRQASAAIHALLASGPGWDWTTMSSLYRATDTYSFQLAALQRAAGAKPDDPSLQFLLAYHFLTIGDAEAAKGALTNAKRLLPTDPVIAQLAQAAGVGGEGTAAKPLPLAADVNLDITGAWTATRADGGKIGLSLTKEGAFAWSVRDQGGKMDSFDGTFSLEDDLLILERKAGGALMGRISALAENRFQFKVLGGGASDPGLTFTK